MPHIGSLAEADRYLSRFYKNTRGGYNLDKIRQLMEFLGNSQENFKTIHVAGTSGKTSTCYYISAFLTATGKKTGLTVSPHVDGLNERLQVNGQPLSEAEFCKALSDFLDLVAKSGIEPSRFEVMVAFVYWYFDKHDIEYAVVEVGLGGLLDGTNVIKRPDKVCVITDIGLDHTEMLGKNVAEIAGQKIGIAQPGSAVFTHQQSEEVMKVFQDWCQKHGADLRIIGQKADNTRLPDYQKRNWQLAHEVYEFLQKRDNLPELNKGQLEATKHINVPGRMDVRTVKGKQVIMDGAHNLQKMTAFANSFRKLYPAAKPAILVSFKEGKDYENLVPLLAPLASRVIVTSFEVMQDVAVHSMDAETLAQAFRNAGQMVEVITDQTQAVRSLLGGQEEICLITGSFYLISQIRNNKLV